MKQRPVFLVLLFFLFPVGCGKDNGTGPANQPPTIQSLSAEPTTVEAEGTATITVEAEDADRDGLTYSWTVSEGSITGSGKSITWTAPATPGNYQIEVTVSNGKKEAYRGIVIEVIEIRDTIDIFPSISTLHLAPGAYPGFTAKYYLLFEVSLTFEVSQNNVNPQLIDAVTATAPDGKIHELKDVEPNGICLIENNAPSDSLYRLASPLSAPPPLGRYTFTVTFTGSSSIQEATKELTEAPLPIPEIIQPENNQETSSTPTLTWEGIPGAAVVYEVKITSPESDPCPPIPIWKKDLIETTTIDVSQPLPIGETYKWYLFSASNREFKNLSLTAGLFKVVSEGEIPKVTGTITVVGEPTGKVSVGCFKRSTFEMVATGSVDSSESYQIELPTTVSGYTFDVRAWDDTNGDGIWNGNEKISVPGNDYLEYQGGQWYVAHWGDQQEPLSPQTPINILL